MPFIQLVNAQQVQIAVAGPGDANTLYLCKGLAQGNFSVQLQANGVLQSSDTWQFEVGPALNPAQFRRAIATAALAGVQESEQGPAAVSWVIQTVFADFDDDSGAVRVSVTNAVQVINQSATAFTSAGVSTLSYDVSILAAIPPLQ
jgi:hypothetical protein